MNRRAFLSRLLGTAALTAAGLVVPARKTYSFLLDNPLALSDDELRRAYMSLSVANRDFIGVPDRHVWGRITIDPKRLTTTIDPTRLMRGTESKSAFARALRQAMDDALASDPIGDADHNRILL